MNNFYEEANDLEPKLIDWRRDFHQFPELRFQETRTAGVVTGYLSSLGIEVQTGVGKTGVVGLIRGKQPGPTALLRFDMDALPIQEETGLDYQSKNAGVMHACGHDGHISMLLVAAKILSNHKDKIKGNIKFVF